MATQKKIETVSNSNTNGNSSEVSSQSSQDAASKVKSLMAEYEKHNQAVTAAKKAVDAAVAARSKVVEQLADTIAPATRFVYKGDRLSISHRGDTYFFRGQSDQENLLEIK